MSMMMLAALPSSSSVCPSPNAWGSPVVYCYGLALLVLAGWALLERHERRACSKQSSELSKACHQLTEQHYRERVQAEERHLLTHDSSVRNVLESLERMLFGKPKA